MKNLFLMSIIFLCSCASVKDLSKVYFNKSTLPKGVKSYSQVLSEHEKTHELRNFFYKNPKDFLLSCIILRNQLYTAALHSNSYAEITSLAKEMELAYENSDEDFLKTCRNVSSTKVGKVFLNTQNSFRK